MKLRHLLVALVALPLLLTACKKDDDGGSGSSDPCDSYPNPTLLFTETDPGTPTGMAFATDIVDDGLEFSLRTNTSGAGGTYSYSVENSDLYLSGDFSLTFELDSLFASGTGPNAVFKIELIDSITSTVIYEVRLTKTPTQIAATYGDPSGTPTSFGPATDLGNSNLTSSISAVRTGSSLQFDATLPGALSMFSPSETATVITTGIQLRITMSGTVGTASGQKSAIKISDVTLDNSEGGYPEKPFGCPTKITEAP